MLTVEPDQESDRDIEESDEDSVSDHEYHSYDDIKDPDVLKLRVYNYKRGRGQVIAYRIGG